MAAFALALMLNNHAIAQVDNELVVSKVNKALDVILESLLTDKLDVVVLKNANGEYAIDKEGSRLTEVKVDPEYTDLNENRLRFGARVTLNTSRWSPGEQTGVGVWAYGELNAEEKTATVGVNANVHTDTIALARFVIAEAVKMVWEDGLELDADLFETMAFNSLTAASTKLKSMEELATLLFFLKGGLVNLAEVDKLQGNVGKENIADLNAFDITFNSTKNELVIAYVPSKDKNDVLESFIKDEQISVSEVRLTENLAQLNVELSFANLEDRTIEQWEIQKQQGLGLLDMFLPALEDPEQAAELTSGIKDFVENVIEFLTEENRELNLF
jgi:hypothetical protein